MKCKCTFKNMTAMALAALMVLAFGLLVGCESSAVGAPGTTPEPTDTQTVASDASTELVVLGTESDSAIKLEVNNATGKDIEHIQIKPVAETVFPAPVNSGDTKLVLDGEAVLYYEPVPAVTAPINAASAEAGDVAQPQLYNVWLAFSAGGGIEIFNLNLGGIEELTFCISDDGLGYIEYTDVNGDSGDTLEAEKTRLADAAAAEEQVRLEAEAAAAAEAEAAAQAANSYDYGSGSGSGSSYQGQSAGKCVDDLVLR